MRKGAHEHVDDALRCFDVATSDRCRWAALTTVPAGARTLKGRMSPAVAMDPGGNRQRKT